MSQKIINPPRTTMTIKNGDIKVFMFLTIALKQYTYKLSTLIY